ncbi:MAG: endonuclease III [Chloroflexi bacterium]|nr:endonuclease III [Chloroflexota bacterium]
MDRLKASKINNLLVSAYGEKPWYCHHDPVSELVLTILSQHTSDINSIRTFNSLRIKFTNWESVTQAEVSDIEKTIKSAGLSRVKAPRIKLVLQKIIEEKGSLDLSFLNDMRVSEAKEWLERLPGVGKKTASCVLLFSLGKPALPVDTHLHRVAKRLGLIDQEVSADKAHAILESLLSKGKIYQFHMNMVEHGRKVCRAINPLCKECNLSNACLYYSLKYAKIDTNTGSGDRL